MSLNPWDESMGVRFGLGCCFLSNRIRWRGNWQESLHFQRQKKARVFRRSSLNPVMPKTLGEGGFSSQFLNILLDNMRLADGTGGGSFAVQLSKLPRSQETTLEQSSMMETFHLLDDFFIETWMIASWGLVWFPGPLVSAGPMSWPFLRSAEAWTALLTQAGDLRGGQGLQWAPVFVDFNQAICWHFSTCFLLEIVGWTVKPSHFIHLYSTFVDVSVAILDATFRHTVILSASLWVDWSCRSWHPQLFWP